MFARVLIALLLTAVCIAFGPTDAHAHAALIAADPADGAVLRQVPDRLTLHFTEPVSPLVLRLTGPEGATDIKTFEVRHQAVEITPPRDLGEGSYALSWRVVSADGHPISGSVVFSVGAPEASRPAAAIAADPSVQIGLWASRLAMYVGAFCGVGGAFFAAWIAGGSKLGRSARQGIIVSLWGGAAATLLALGLQGLDALALPLRALGGEAAWGQGLATSFTITACAVLLAMLAGLLSLMTKRQRQRQVLSGAALAGIGLAFAASGHASTAEPQWLTRPAVFVHVAGLAFWVGALLPLLTMLRPMEPRSAVVVNRFSAAILPVVVLLMIAGAVLAVVQVGSPPALWNTPYGNILLLKLVVVGGLLVLASVNRLLFTPALTRNEVRQTRWFARSIAAEGVLVLIILGLAAGWRFTPPPRAILNGPSASPPAMPSEPVLAHLHTDQAMALVTVDPGRAGRTSMTIRLISPSRSSLNPREVAVAVSSPSSGIEPFERHAVQASPGIWSSEDLVFPVAGTWQLRIDVLVSDFEKIVLEGKIEIRP